MLMWLLGSTSMLNRALVPPRGFELVVTPLLHLPEVCSRTTMWLQIYGMAPPPEPPCGSGPVLANWSHLPIEGLLSRHMALTHGGPLAPLP
jgi:hypothetical protein